MIYNLSRGQVEQNGMAGAGQSDETELTRTVRVLNMFDLVVHKNDQSVTPCLVRDGFWEAWITAWFTRWLRPGMTVLDVGANCGYYTMLFEKLVGPHGKVTAYEPNPVYADLLRQTRRVNDAQFEVREVALSDSADSVNLSVPADFHGSASITVDFSDTQWGESSRYAVETSTLDSEWQFVDVVKLDVEGAEELVWHGGQRLFHAGFTTIVLEYTPGAYSETFLDELYEWGNVSSITFDGDEIPVTKAVIEAQTDWTMLVIRRK